MKLQLLIALIIVGLLFVAVIYLEATTTGEVIEATEFDLGELQDVIEASEQEVIDMKPDFIDENLGTLVIWTNVDLRDRSEGIVEFFASRKIKGLRIRYRLDDRRLTGGLPVLVSESENSLDGNRHMIGYSFERDKDQVLVYDGHIVAKGEFSGKEQELPVGMVVWSHPEQVESESVDTYMRILSEEEFKDLFDSQS